MKAMNLKFLKAGLAGMILLTGISFAVAGNPDKKATADPNAKPQIEMRRDGHMGALPDLTEKQKEQIKAIRTASKASVLPIRASLQEKEAHLKTLMIADKADMGQIQTSVTEISDLKGKMMLERMKSQQEIRKILTPEQRTAFDSQILTRGGGHGRHGGMHRGGGHGKGHGGYHKGGMDHRGGNQGRPTPPPADK